MHLKKKKKLCPSSFVKAKTKEREKAFSCESAADPALSGQRLFLQARQMAMRN